MTTIATEMVTTALELPGMRIMRNLGLVRGIVVRSRSVVGNIVPGLQTLFGGNITIYTNLCERAREDAYGLMAAHACAGRRQRRDLHVLRCQRSHVRSDGSVGLRHGSRRRKCAVEPRNTRPAVSSDFGELSRAAEPMDTDTDDDGNYEEETTKYANDTKERL